MHYTVDQIQGRGGATETVFPLQTVHGKQSEQVRGFISLPFPSCHKVSTFLKSFRGLQSQAVKSARLTVSEFQSTLLASGSITTPLYPKLLPGPERLFRHFWVKISFQKCFVRSVTLQLFSIVVLKIQLQFFFSIFSEVQSWNFELFQGTEDGTFTLVLAKTQVKCSIQPLSCRVLTFQHWAQLIPK